MSATAQPKGDLTDVSFAADVVEVYRHIKGSYGERKVGYTESRKFLHDWATKTVKKKDAEDEYVNLEKFMGWVQKAEDTLNKAKKKEVDGALEKEEKKTVAELQKLIDEEIAKVKR